MFSLGIGTNPSASSICCHWALRWKSRSCVSFSFFSVSSFNPFFVLQFFFSNFCAFALTLILVNMMRIGFVQKKKKNAFLDKVLSTWISALRIKRVRFSLSFFLKHNFNIMMMNFSCLLCLSNYSLAETFCMFYDHICRIIKVVLVREDRKWG